MSNQLEFHIDQPVSGPLAHRTRAQTLDQFVGQEHLLGAGKPIRLAIEQDNLTSCILWGPPGCGKTTLAHIIAHQTKAKFQQLNAGTTGVPELRKYINQAQEATKFQARSTILFLDEIHRFNKAQQDFLLSFVEDGTIRLIGATTENPSFEINSALLSRMQVYPFQPLEPHHIQQLIQRALNDTDLSHMQVDLTKEGEQSLVLLAGGDIRLALNALELAVQTCQPDAQQRRRIQPDQIQEAVQKRIFRHDKQGDSHYDLISALIKSVRGSNPDAAIYWLVRLLEGGEDARFIARRLVILASEDIGLADPQALLIADAAARAVEYVGLPEAQLNLAHATIYLACAAKSNSAYQALLAAQAEVKQKPAYPVPLHLRNAPTQLMKELGYGQGYQYDHQTPDHVADQEHLPKELQGATYYQPTSIGCEKQIQAHLETIRKGQIRLKSKTYPPEEHSR